MYTINIVVGDWSDDGHGKTETFVFECSHSPEDVQTAHTKGITAEQHKVIDTIAEEYEDQTLTEDHIRVLEEIGFDVAHMEFRNADSEFDEPYITNDEFVNLYWHIVKRGNTEITHSHKIAASITIGGYGFFY